ncbi:conserved hypothetical protein (DUF4369) [Formosa agariphila KMM 3901]|uniref:DUF4369 domain-containing protein n=1 Tax=Formosa agariphila (strain DSM 15362 / KCTC 12365 / LMG 23005 / KMM 3901 / M-2Alg 35-1) TaxID=1347342 RepID=T2KJ99_FORAG|nr:DUF4369 domain-containing protein [Formosa agariphila]CDF78501.1 conserved hypothetical protein (DUF4369) [Formosa agariphila KMM 3901]
MKNLSILLLLLIVISCGKDQGNLTVNAHVKGLKKGTVYLQKIDDSLLVTLDSLRINGNETFELHGEVDTPEIFYLVLNKHDKSYERIPFFAEAGRININTTLKNFVTDAKISGSKNQALLDEYNVMNVKMSNARLDLIQAKFEAIQAKDSIKIDSIIKLDEGLIKRKYLFTVNYAINHKDSEIAPYLALSEIYDANVKWLDTINSSLTPEIKSSKYGTQLQRYLEDIKK